jgi:hypothetical protein
MHMLGRRAVVVTAILGATAFSGGALAATHGSNHQSAKPKPAKRAPQLTQHLSRHHCHLSGGAGSSAAL